MFGELSNRWDHPAMGNRATLQPNESAFHNGELNLLQRLNWSWSERRGENKLIVFTQLFPDTTNMDKVENTADYDLSLLAR